MQEDYIMRKTENISCSAVVQWLIFLHNFIQEMQNYLSIVNNENWFHKMVKQTQTIRRPMPTNC